MTDGIEHGGAGDPRDVLGTDLPGGGLTLSEPDRAAVTAFLAAFAPALDALTAAGRELTHDFDDHALSPDFSVEWQ